MADALGIELHPDVLPFSNLPAYLPPFLLRPNLVLTLAGQGRQRPAWPGDVARPNGVGRLAGRTSQPGCLSR
jgi:hypothetical protein